MIKIAFVIHSLHYKSGTQRVACHLANLFAEKLKYQVTILNMDTHFGQAAYDLSPSVKVQAFTGGYFKFYHQLQQYINDDQPDFIIIHNMGRLSLLCSALKKNNTRLISLEHVAFNSRPTWVKIFSKILYKKINTVVCLTKNDMLNYQDWFDDVQVIYNISPFFIPNEVGVKDKKIISVGRLTYQKNFQALLMAWKIIQDRIDDWTLEIYGDGEDYNDLQGIISSHTLKNVFLMGQTNDVEKVYNQSSIFVMSSRYEGLPMVLIEAQTFGLPIVSFDCPHGPAEVITHQANGILVENQNIGLLAQTMLDLISNNQQREQYSIQALKDAQKFQQSSILEMWKVLLEK